MGGASTKRKKEKKKDFQVGLLQEALGHAIALIPVPCHLTKLMYLL